MIDAEYLRSRLRYHHETGDLTWRPLPEKSFWNARFEGKVAGTIDPKGYVIVRISGIPYKAHRLVWIITYGRWPFGLIDHIDGDRANNRINNLRDVSLSGNQQNRRNPSKSNNSGYLSVTTLRTGKFSASIKVDGKISYLGTFTTPEDAHLSYLNAKRRLHRTCTI